MNYREKLSAYYLRQKTIHWKLANWCSVYYDDKNGVTRRHWLFKYYISNWWSSKWIPIKVKRMETAAFKRYNDAWQLQISTGLASIEAGLAWDKAKANLNKIEKDIPIRYCWIKKKSN